MGLGSSQPVPSAALKKGPDTKTMNRLFELLAAHGLGSAVELSVPQRNSRSKPRLVGHRASPALLAGCWCCLPACLPAGLPACLPAGLPACLLAGLPACLLAGSPACLPACPPAMATTLHYMGAHSSPACVTARAAAGARVSGSGPGPDAADDSRSGGGGD
jgi:hypothetical protein